MGRRNDIHLTNQMKMKDDLNLFTTRPCSFDCRTFVHDTAAANAYEMSPVGRTHLLIQFISISFTCKNPICKGMNLLIKQSTQSNPLLPFCYVTLTHSHEGEDRIHINDTVRLCSLFNMQEQH